MAIEITINGELRLDQSSGLQDDDIELDNTLTGLNTTFRSALLGLAGDLILSQAQKDFAADANAASESNYVTVSTDGENVTDLFFSDPSGDLFDGDQVFIDNDPLGDPLQTVNGDNIYLWSLSGNLVIATNDPDEGEGDVVAAFYLDESGDHLSAGVQTVTFIPLAHPDTGSTDETVNWSDLLNISAAGSASFDFDALKSGSSLWVAVGSESGGVLVTGLDAQVNPATGKKTNASDVIHTSQGGDGTTIGLDNQLFDNLGETAVFTLVTGLDTITGDDGATGDYVVDPNTNDAKAEGIDYNGYLNVTGAGIYISQSQGSPSTTKSFDIELFSAGGGTTAESGFDYISGLGDDDEIDVGTVTVTNDDGEVVGIWGVGNTASGTPLHSSSANGETDVTITINGNHIEVDGVFGEFTVSWTSLNDVEFNRFTLASESGQFDVGRVDILQGLVVTEPIGDTIFVDDDGPSLPPATQDVLELVTDDTDVDDPSTDTLSTDDIFTGAPVYGTDGPSLIDPILYSLRVVGTDPDSGLVDTATDKAILLMEDNGDVVGIVDEDGNGSIDGSESIVAIRWSLSTPDPLDLDTEIVTFTQYRSVVHDDPNDPEEDGTPSAPETVNGGLVFIDQTAIDGDEDPSSVVSFDLGAVTQLWDDGPSIGDTNGEIDDSIVDFVAGASDTKSLEGVVGEDPNSSPYTITDFTASLTTNGVLLNGILSNNGTLVTYWADTDGDTVFGSGGDTAYYTMELDQDDNSGAGSYTFTVLVNPPPAFTPFDFTDLPSGQNLFGCIAADKSDLDGLALFTIPKGADVNDPGDGEMTNTSKTTNTSKGGGPVTIGNTNQMIDPGEGNYFAYLSDPDDAMVAGVTGGLNQNSADDADTIGFADTVGATTAQVEIVQVQGGSPATVDIKAYDIDVTANYGADGVTTDAEARDFAETPLLPGDDPVNILAVRVYDENGDLVEVWEDPEKDGTYANTLNDSPVTVQFLSAGVADVFYARVAGVQDDYTIEFETEFDHDLALVECFAGKFDIGGFNILEDSATPDQFLEFEATATDGDGDTDVATWEIGIDGTGGFNDNQVSGVVI